MVDLLADPTGDLCRDSVDTLRTVARGEPFGGEGLLVFHSAMIALLPFMVPYAIASRLYGFKRTIEEIKLYSAWPTNWLAVENRNKLWNRMGVAVFEGWKIKLFPGSCQSCFRFQHFSRAMIRPTRSIRDQRHHSLPGCPGLTAFDCDSVCAVTTAIGFDHSDAFLQSLR